MSHHGRFKSIVGNLLAGMDDLHALLEEISLSSDCVQTVESLNELDEQRVTVLEPAILKVKIDQVMALCADLSLIEYCHREDPKRVLVDEEDRNWFTYTVESGRVTVNGIKAIRRCLDYRFIDLRDAKRIAELILEGKIK